MASDRKLTVSYSLKPPQGTEAPISKQSKQVIPPEQVISFPLGPPESLDYKKILTAIQEAKEVTGADILTPWRDAVGDREKGKDIKKAKAATEEDEEEEIDEEAV